MFQKSTYFETSPDKTLKNEREIQMFIEDNINVKMPLDGPLWRMYGQKYTDPDTGKVSFIVIWKCHHSLNDGLSNMAQITSALCDDFSKDMFIKVNPINMA